MKCVCCNGEGLIDATIDGDPDTPYLVCDSCQGSGQVYTEKSVQVTGFWLHRPNHIPGEQPEILVEIDGAWRKVFSAKEMEHHVSLIRECHPELWPVVDFEKEE